MKAEVKSNGRINITDATRQDIINLAQSIFAPACREWHFRDDHEDRLDLELDRFLYNHGNDENIIESAKTPAKDMVSEIQFAYELLVGCRTMANGFDDKEKRLRVLDGAVCEVLKILYEQAFGK